MLFYTNIQLIWKGIAYIGIGDIFRVVQLLRGKKDAVDWQNSSVRRSYDRQMERLRDGECITTRSKNVALPEIINILGMLKDGLHELTGTHGKYQNIVKNRYKPWSMIITDLEEIKTEDLLADIRVRINKERRIKGDFNTEFMLYMLFCKLLPREFVEQVEQHTSNIDLQYFDYFDYTKSKITLKRKKGVPLDPVKYRCQVVQELPDSLKCELSEGVQILLSTTVSEKEIAHFTYPLLEIELNMACLAYVMISCAKLLNERTPEMNLCIVDNPMETWMDLLVERTGCKSNIDFIEKLANQRGGKVIKATEKEKNAKVFYDWRSGKMPKWETINDIAVVVANQNNEHFADEMIRIYAEYALIHCNKWCGKFDDNFNRATKLKGVNEKAICYTMIKHWLSKFLLEKK